MLYITLRSNKTTNMSQDV